MLIPFKNGRSGAQLDAGLTSLVKEGVYAQLVGTLTSGVILMGFALELGASNAVIGLLAAVPFFTQLVQVPAVLLVERVRRRRTIAVTALAAARLLLLPLALLPFFASKEVALAGLVIGVTGGGALGAIATCSWNSWVHDLVPAQRLGGFFSRKIFLATVFSAVAALGTGLFIDAWTVWRPEAKELAYSILYMIALAAGAASTWHLSRVPDAPFAVPKATEGLGQMILKPFRDANFRRLMLFLGWWSFAVNLATPFFTVYLVQTLGFDMSFVIALTVVTQAAHLLVLRQWGRLSDRFNNKSILAVCAPVFILCILAWIFTALPGRHALTVPLLVLLHVLMGISAAGVGLASGNIGLKLAPRGKATSYLAANSIVNALAAGMAPVIAGYFADDFAGRQLSLAVRWADNGSAMEFLTLKVRHWDFFFVAAFVLGAFSLRRLSLVREEGEVKEGVILEALWHDVRRGVRTIAGRAPKSAAAEQPAIRKADAA